MNKQPKAQSTDTESEKCHCFSRLHFESLTNMIACSTSDILCLIYIGHKENLSPELSSKINVQKEVEIVSSSTWDNCSFYFI